MFLSSDVIIQKLNSIEKQNRRWKWIAAFFIISMLVLNFSKPAFTNNQKIEANEFVLKGINGQVLGRWNADKYGSNLHFYDIGGKERILLGIGKHVSSYLNLNDGGGNKRIIIGQEGQGNSIDLIDSSGRYDIILGVDDLGNIASIDLTNAKGTHKSLHP